MPPEIAPIAALREVSVDRSASSTCAPSPASVITGGIAALHGGPAGEIALVGLGALATFVGVAVLGPVLATLRPLFGLPLAARGLTGELTTRDAQPEAHGAPPRR